MSASKRPTVFVFDPTAVPRELANSLAPRLESLGGATIGFLWNNKPNGDVLFSRLEKLLRQKYEISGAVHGWKHTASIPAPEAVIHELTASAQAVIVGLGD